METTVPNATQDHSDPVISTCLVTMQYTAEKKRYPQLRQMKNALATARLTKNCGFCPEPLGMPQPLALRYNIFKSAI